MLNNEKQGYLLVCRKSGRHEDLCHDPGNRRTESTNHFEGIVSPLSVVISLGSLFWEMRETEIRNFFLFFFFSSLLFLFFSFLFFRYPSRSLSSLSLSLSLFISLPGLTVFVIYSVLLWSLSFQQQKTTENITKN